MQRPIYEAVVGEGIPDLDLWVRVRKTLLNGTLYNYSLTVHDPTNTTTLFTKTTGFTGQVGSGDGKRTADVPNVIVQWDPPAETSLLTNGALHDALLSVTRLADNKVAYYPFVIRGVPQFG